jgi:hypothetical protein
VNEKKTTHTSWLTLFMINHNKKEFEYGSDTAKVLNKLKEFKVSHYKPVLQTSASEESMNILKDYQYKLAFKEEFSVFMIRK